MEFYNNQKNTCELLLYESHFKMYYIIGKLNKFFYLRIIMIFCLFEQCNNKSKKHTT